MQTPANPGSERRLSEDEAHLLLARAAELDVRQLATVRILTLQRTPVGAA